MSNFYINILLSSFLLLELILFHGFHSRRKGKRTVFSPWHSWLIDLTALFTGIALMAFSLLTLYFPNVYPIQAPNFLMYSLFLLGSWQFALHLVKLVVRNAKMHLERRRLEIEIDLEKYRDLDRFEDVYNQEVEEYARQMNKQV